MKVSAYKILTILFFVFLSMEILMLNKSNSILYSTLSFKNGSYCGKINNELVSLEFEDSNLVHVYLGPATTNIAEHIETDSFAYINNKIFFYKNHSKVLEAISGASLFKNGNDYIIKKDQTILTSKSCLPRIPQDLEIRKIIPAKDPMKFLLLNGNYPVI